MNRLFLFPQRFRRQPRKSVFRTAPTKRYVEDLQQRLLLSCNHVVLDAGHGGDATVGNSSANNATSPSGLLEKDLTLELAQRIQPLLEAQGFTVSQTRNGDNNLSLVDRAGKAKALIDDESEHIFFLSIHFNGFDSPEVRGTETLIRSTGNVNASDDRVFAEAIQSATVSPWLSLGGQSRGVRSGGFGVLSDSSLGNTSDRSPVVSALLEVEFITNPAVDAEISKDGIPIFDTLAASIADGIVKARNQLCGGDIAFVIDTTSSMQDDIDAVKASARQIVNEIFDDGSQSRVGIVVYRDHEDDYVTRTQLPFSSDRDAVLSAINSITVAGGGDFPEAVFSGLLHAIDGLGGLGGWRGEGTPKKIILIGDASPHDPEPVTGYTRATISERAAAGGIEIDDRIPPTAPVLADPSTNSDSSVVAGSESIPIDIFTITIGNIPETLAAFGALARENRGEAFTALDADDVVQAITDVLDAIDEPDIDAGLIWGRKFEDRNDNGAHDPSEPWLNGWTMELRNSEDVVIQTYITGDYDLNEDGIIDPQSETGVYIFNNVPNGSFTVTERKRDGWAQTFPSSQAQIDAYALDRLVDLQFSGHDFYDWGGLKERWLWSRTGWHYVTPNGNVFEWVDGEKRSIRGQLVAELSTDYYQEISLITDPAPSITHEVLLDDSDREFQLNFGNRGTGSIIGQKFHDLNSDGVLNPSDPRLNGWTVQLVDSATSTVVMEVMTRDIDFDADGEIDPQSERGVYQFEGLTPGAYQIREVPQAHWKDTSDYGTQRLADHLNATLGLDHTGSTFFDWGGQSEKWIKGTAAWYFVTPDGTLWEWNGSSQGELTGLEVARLDTKFYDDVTLLTDAEPPVFPELTLSPGQHTSGPDIGSVFTGGCHPMVSEGHSPGSVTAFLSRGNLVILGDRGDNHVTIFSDDVGRTTVQGHNGTEVNGDEKFEFDIELGNMTLSLGSGNDSVCIRQIEVGNRVLINTGNGVDHILMNEVQAGGSLSINTQSSGSNVVILNSLVGGNFYLYGGNFEDNLVMADSTVAKSTYINLFGGDDRIALSSAGFQGALNIYGGGGADRFSVSALTEVTDDVDIYGGAGVDSARWQSGSLLTESVTWHAVEVIDDSEDDSLLDEILEEFSLNGLMIPLRTGL